MYSALIFMSWPFRLNGYCRLSVCPSVCKLLLVSTITRHRFELESPNLHQTCIMGYFQLLLNMETIDLHLQGHLGHFVSELQEIWLICVISRHRFRLDSPNLHQTCILGYSRLVLKMEVIDFDLQGHFGHIDSEFQEKADLGRPRVVSCPKMFSEYCYCFTT